MVSKEELIDLYNLADLFVFPSLYEGFGIPPLEAMACGTPVIAANNSSIPEVCGDAAVYFDGKNTEELVERVEELLKDGHNNKMLDEGYKQYKRFSWEKTRETVKMIIKEV